MKTPVLPKSLPQKKDLQCKSSEQRGTLSLAHGKLHLKGTPIVDWQGAILDLRKGAFLLPRYALAEKRGGRGQLDSSVLSSLKKTYHVLVKWAYLLEKESGDSQNASRERMDIFGP
uniref:Uncharacterized protein n=1 Tax=Micrurus spixii TaxID=129469 RepID=A0A2D4MC15_9SAUR